MSYTVYGLTNCDVTQKAIKWLKENNIEFVFKNNKIETFNELQLQQWCAQVGWEKLLNKRGTSFKSLHPLVQLNATTEKAAIEIMKEKTSTIKRPLIEKNGKIITLGFDVKKYEIAYL